MPFYYDNYASINRPCQQTLAWVTFKRGGLALLLLWAFSFDSLDLTLWLGWFGFRIWWLVPELFRPNLTSGVTLMWGRVRPLVEGGLYAKHMDTHRWVLPTLPMRQVNIAGTYYFIVKDY